jgi:tRNA A37 threonylcarbamoyladenosine dehydratase
MPAVMAPDFERRFGGLARLYGVDGAARIRAAHVAVVGIGGVGSWAVEALARSGVGALTLVDMDHVVESNVNRQVQAIDDTIGQAKVIAMHGRITQINPACVVHEVDQFVERGNWPGLLPHPVDAVIDACDGLTAKAVLSAWALKDQQPFVVVGSAGGRQHAERVEVADMAEVSHDALITRLRWQLRRHDGAARGQKLIGIPCVFSRESEATPAGAAVHDGTLNCHGFGSSVTVTATFGLCAAGWVLNRLAAAG